MQGILKQTTGRLVLTQNVYMDLADLFLTAVPGQQQAGIRFFCEGFKQHGLYRGSGPPLQVRDRGVLDATARQGYHKRAYYDGS